MINSVENYDVNKDNFVFNTIPYDSQIDIRNKVVSDIDKLKTFFGYSNVIEIFYGYNNENGKKTIDFFKEGEEQIYIIPILFETKVNGINLYFNTSKINQISYLCIKLKSGDIKSHVLTSFKDNDTQQYYNDLNSKYSLIDENYKILDQEDKANSSAQQGEQDLLKLEGFYNVDEDEDGEYEKKGYYACPKLITYYYFEDIDSDPFKIDCTDNFFMYYNRISYQNINFISGFSTNYFSFFPVADIIAFRDDCIFLPKNYKEFLVNNASDIQYHNYNEGSFYPMPFNTIPYYIGDDNNVGLPLWFTKDPTNLSDVWYGHICSSFILK